MDGVCRLTITKVLLGFMLITTAGTAHSQAIRDSVITHSYPRLYSAILKRRAAKIFPFTQNTDSTVRKQAWRALAQTPVDSLSRLIDKVKNDGSPVAWFALSIHDLSAQQLRDLEWYWLQHLDERAGVNGVLGQQGDARALHFLLNHLPEIRDSKYEKTGALAISRLLIKYPVNKLQQKKVINTAFSAKNDTLTRTWLYGFYRGPKTKLTPKLKDTIRAKWQAYGVGKNADVDQYVAKILTPGVFAKIIHHYNQTLQHHVQLGVELAHSVAKVSLNSINRKAIKKLLDQPNVHVVQQTLASLTGKIQPGDSLFSYIKTNILETHSTAPKAWLEALNTLAEVDSCLVLNYKDRLNDLSEHHPYFYPAVLKAQMKVEKPAIFLKRIDNAVGAKGHLQSMYAVNALNEFWSQKEHHTKTFKNEIRSVVFKALSMHDRGVTYSTEPLLEDSLLFSKSDFTEINRYLSAFRLPGDVEVYQTFGALYKKRFPEQAQPMIDSLAALNYVPLNRSLKRNGWDVHIPKNTPRFREPNWKRLWQMGRDPVWVLKTDKGIIRVKMNTLSAPATVSAIDSLTRAGSYGGVPFHRVVSNFVIQGGDIERGDGFGGPDFVIPTEPSDDGFVRGAAGIASAGSDTEGSQYFFMLQWAPHLNGHYTLFGRVIEGMEVVDQIVVGDKVEKAYWE